MSPDKYFLLAGIIFNICTYVALVWRNRKSDILVEGTNKWKFKRMWREYAEKHNIPLNGDD
jgi:hypothetical protein